MAKKSKAYWVKRAEALENRANAKGEALAKKLKRDYERAAKEIRSKIDAFYGRYATEQGLSYADAVKRLNSKEAREWKKTLGEYVDEINAMPKGKSKDKLVAELDARSYASQQDRLSSLNAQIEMELDRLFATGEQQMTATMTDIFEDGYYRKVFDLQQRAGVISPFTKLSTDMIEDVLTYPWSGSDFSTRLWNNKRALLFNTRETITQGLIQGQSVARMSKSLADAMGKSYHQAETLIRTETNHFHAEADTRAYEAAGVEEYEFVATLDSRTSEACASLDGKHFPIKEAKTGVNYPPMHPRCRSTTVEYDPEDSSDWAASGQPMPENMTYEEWQKEQEEKYGAGYVETERKKEYNYRADKEQFEAYKLVLPSEEMPKKFEGFQDIKYSDPERYGMMKTKVRLYNQANKTGTIPNSQTAATTQDKIQGYALNSNHKHGKHKARAINQVLGYHYENWIEFSDKLFKEVQKSPASKGIVTPYGEKYTATIVMFGKKGRYMRLKSVWQIDKGSNIPRLITIVPD